MLDEREIRKEIARLEYEESSYPNYAKLADLYAIRREMRGVNEFVGAYSSAAPPEPVAQYTVGEYGDSDFLLAVAGKDPAKAWAVVDELMDTLAMVNSKVYNSVMQKVQRI